MTLTINLKDPKYCDGCPCWNHDSEYGDSCNLEYWNTWEDVAVVTDKKTRKIIMPYKDRWKKMTQRERDKIASAKWQEKNPLWTMIEKVLRPQRCIKENGL